MIIQLNERHLGNYAERKHIEPIINDLKTLGWNVEYSGGDCIWEFQNEKQYTDFELLFEQECEKLMGRFYWRVCYQVDRL